MKPRLLAALATCAALVLPAVGLTPGPASAAEVVSSARWRRVYADWNRTSSPTIGDVNRDGVNDVAFGSQDGWLKVVDGRNGHDVPGWPQPATVVPGVATAIDASPAIADLDNDGANEVIVGAGTNWPRANAQPGGIVVFWSNGAVRCRKALPSHGGFTQVYSTPAIGDVDGDGRRDIVFGSFNHYIYAIDRNCNDLPGFPFFQHDTVWASPALYDADNDGRVEIFIGGDSSPGGPEGWQGGDFRRLDWTPGGVAQVWRRTINNTFFSSAAIGDIDGDGRFEAVTGAGQYYQDADGIADAKKVWAFHLNDGSDTPGWPQSTSSWTDAAPAIGDIDGDGRPREVVQASEDGNVWAWRGNGSRLWSKRVASGTKINASPILADIRGDRAEDVIIGTDVAMHVLDGRGGGNVKTFGSNWSYEAAAAVGKFGSQWRVVTAAIDTPGHRTRVAAYDISTPRKTSWPMWRKNAWHLGAIPSGGDPLPPGYCSRPSNPKAKPSSKSARGYWFLGGDGGVFSFGKAQFYGSLPSIGVRSRTIGIVPTRSANGYWVLSGDGGVFSFGDAKFYGSMGGRRLNAPIIRMARTASGKGYYLLASDGGVFSFGDARFFGSTGGRRLNAPVISMAVTPTGRGYWLLAADGGVFSFGDARFFGSTGGLRLDAPVISMAVRPQGNGYWLLGGDGGVFSFGKSRFHGSLPGTGLCVWSAAVQLRSSQTGNGYWLLGGDGGVFSFGDAKFFGSQPGLVGDRRAIDMAIKP